MSAGPLPDENGFAGLSRWQTASAGTHLLISVLTATVVGVALAYPIGFEPAGLVAWTTAATVFLAWTWRSVWRLDGRDTALLARREDPSRAVRDVVLLLAAVGSLLTVALVIFSAHRSGPLRVSLGVVSVIASWAVVHTVFTLKYAALFYTEPVGGLDFTQDPDPTFRDFAYVAFTVGMTFQVSDTDVQQGAMRATVLRHALISYLFGVVIIAVTINLVAGLSR